MIKKIIFGLIGFVLFTSLSINANALVDPIYDALDYCNNQDGINFTWKDETQGWVEIKERGRRNLCKFDDDTVCEVWQYYDGKCKKGIYKDFKIYAAVKNLPNLAIEKGGRYSGYLTENPTGNEITILGNSETPFSPDSLSEDQLNSNLHQANWVGKEQAQYYLTGINVCNYKGEKISNMAVLKYNGKNIYDIPTLKRGECAPITIIAFVPVVDETKIFKFEIDNHLEELTTLDNEYIFSIGRSEGFKSIYKGREEYDYDYNKGYYLTLNNKIINESTATFSDLTDGHRYSEAIGFLKGKKIVAGYPDGSFKPDSQINRAELLKIIIASKFTDKIISSALSDYKQKKYQYVDFNDVMIDAWHAPYVRVAIKEGVVQGYPDGTFKPAQDVNFVEALKITMKAYNIEYDENTSIWYQGMVQKAYELNLIPLDVNGFDLKISRAQISELITRVIKYKDGSLNDYLGPVKCGGWDTFGEVTCDCNGDITKSECPANADCDNGQYFCKGFCGACKCFKGGSENGIEEPCNDRESYFK